MTPLSVLLRPARSKGRYRNGLCPACAAPVRWIPEAPGSLAGKACGSCCRVFCDVASGDGSAAIRLHPYARMVNPGLAQSRRAA